MWGISVANKRREELLELVIEIIDEQGNQMSIAMKLLVTDDGTIPELLAQVGLGN